jgi:uncharacterized YigZ family protein
LPEPAKSDFYRVVVGNGSAEVREKGSRFIGYVAPSESEDEAQQVLAEIRRSMHDATHHCSAWRIGPRAEVWRANDDGEPSGSAGQPILRRIEAADVTNCVVVVTRYYGGTKLGTGGLVRAYGETAARAIEETQTALRVVSVSFTLRFAYPDTSAAVRTVETFHGRIDDASYTDDTLLTVLIPFSLADGFELATTEALAGRGELRRLQE